MRTSQEERRFMQRLLRPVDTPLVRSSLQAIVIVSFLQVLPGCQSVSTLVVVLVDDLQNESCGIVGDLWHMS